MAKELTIEEKMNLILENTNEILKRLKQNDRPVTTLDEPKNPPPRPPGGG